MCLAPAPHMTLATSAPAKLKKLPKKGKEKSCTAIRVIKDSPLGSGGDRTLIKEVPQMVLYDSESEGEDDPM
ncbi:hypothetical protein NXF25_012600 [Crotalus adamanteus]|uniref:Uncharacterized protein n=1 Tax=Crotalus adamanteus TaxID=8729 RepID=A0AAW1BCY6_CROAD